MIFSKSSNLCTKKHHALEDIYTGYKTNISKGAQWGQETVNIDCGVTDR